MHLELDARFSCVGHGSLSVVLDGQDTSLSISLTPADSNAQLAATRWRPVSGQTASGNRQSGSCSESPAEVCGAVRI